MYILTPNCKSLNERIFLLYSSCLFLYLPLLVVWIFCLRIYWWSFLRFIFPNHSSLFLLESAVWILLLIMVMSLYYSFLCNPLSYHRNNWMFSLIFHFNYPLNRCLNHLWNFDYSRFLFHSHSHSFFYFVVHLIVLIYFNLNYSFSSITHFVILLNLLFYL